MEQAMPLVRRYKSQLTQGTYKTGACARCCQTAPIVGRGLCDACRHWVRKYGDIEEYPRKTNRLSDVYAEYQMIRSGGGTVEQLAARIGVSVHSLRHAIRQARNEAAQS